MALDRQPSARLSALPAVDRAGHSRPERSTPKPKEHIMSEPTKTVSTSSLLQENRTFPPPPEVVKRAHINAEQYQTMYERSVKDPDAFWLEQARHARMVQEADRRPQIHLGHRRAKDPAHLVRGRRAQRQRQLPRPPSQDRARATSPPSSGRASRRTTCSTLTYEQLHREVCKFANVLKSLGIKKGDRVSIYMPMVPELPVAMLACARIGAIHSIVFGGFSADALAGPHQRFRPASCSSPPTSALRAGKSIPLKDIADEALKHCPSIEKVVVVKRNDTPCNMTAGRDLWYHDLMAKASRRLRARADEGGGSAVHALHLRLDRQTQGRRPHHRRLPAALPRSRTNTSSTFMTTTSTGARRTSAGSPATATSSMARSATARPALMFEGVPTFPDAGRFWQIVEKFKVTVFYTAPTAIRSLIRLGEEWPNKYDLELAARARLGRRTDQSRSVDVVSPRHRQGAAAPSWTPGGRPKPAASSSRRCPARTRSNPAAPAGRSSASSRWSCATTAASAAPNEGGKLCIKKPWPGMMRTTWGDHDRFIDTYFTMYQEHLLHRRRLPRGSRTAITG